MRLAVASLVLLGLSAPVLAQERGSFALDAMTTPGRHVGFGYYLTDGFSLRPTLGFGYSSQFGTTFNLGTDLRWELLHKGRVSPYLSASFDYMRDPAVVQYDSSGTLQPNDSNVMRYGAGLGVRTRLAHRVSLVGEARVMNSELQTLSGGYYGQRAIKDGAHFEAVLGASYTFN